MRRFNRGGGVGSSSREVSGLGYRARDDDDTRIVVVRFIGGGSGGSDRGSGNGGDMVVRTHRHHSRNRKLRYQANSKCPHRLMHLAVWGHVQGWGSDSSFDCIVRVRTARTLLVT